MRPRRARVAGVRAGDERGREVRGPAGTDEGEGQVQRRQAPHAREALDGVARDLGAAQRERDERRELRRAVRVVQTYLVQERRGVQGPRVTGGFRGRRAAPRRLFGSRALLWSGLLVGGGGGALMIRRPARPGRRA